MLLVKFHAFSYFYHVFMHYAWKYKLRYCLYLYINTRLYRSLSYLSLPLFFLFHLSLHHSLHLSFTLPCTAHVFVINEFNKGDILKANCYHQIIINQYTAEKKTYFRLNSQHAHMPYDSSREAKVRRIRIHSKVRLRWFCPQRISVQE